MKLSFCLAIEKVAADLNIIQKGVTIRLFCPHQYISRSYYQVKT